jgi:hypothetical protein
VIGDTPSPGTTIHHNSKVRELSKGMVTQLHLALVMAIDAAERRIAHDVSAPPPDAAAPEVDVEPPASRRSSS